MLKDMYGGPKKNGICLDQERDQSKNKFLLSYMFGSQYEGTGGGLDNYYIQHNKDRYGIKENEEKLTIPQLEVLCHADDILIITKNGDDLQRMLF